MNYFVTGIGTDSGKTIISAILCEALKADYWKPVQAGLPRDTETVAALISNKTTVLHPERFVLRTPASPHAAAKIDGVNISLDSFSLPETSNALIVEGAGGCMVPLNDHDVVADLIAKLAMTTIVVSNHYLGSINHTLLTVEMLKHRMIPIAGLIFNGDENPETERIILHRTKVPCLLRIKREVVVDKTVIAKYAKELNRNWNG